MVEIEKNFILKSWDRKFQQLSAWFYKFSSF